MNSSTVFNRPLFKEKFKEIYNSNKFNFPINTSFLSNIITKWKSTSYKMTKSIVFIEKFDYNNRLIFRDFQSKYVEYEGKKKPINIEFIIWGNDENINRMRISNKIFIDATFHHPMEYSQLLIIMYIDSLKNTKIAGLYILMNGKQEIIYDYVLNL